MNARFCTITCGFCGETHVGRGEEVWNAAERCCSGFAEGWRKKCDRAKTWLLYGTVHDVERAHYLGWDEDAEEDLIEVVTRCGITAVVHEQATVRQDNPVYPACRPSTTAPDEVAS